MARWLAALTGLGAIIGMCAATAGVILMFALMFQFSEWLNRITGIYWMGGIVYFSPVWVPLLGFIFCAAYCAARDL